MVHIIIAVNTSATLKVCVRNLEFFTLNFSRLNINVGYR
jgi:hypothetical protein